MSDDANTQQNCPFERKDCPCVLLACQGPSLTLYQDYVARGGVLGELEFWQAHTQAEHDLYGSLPHDEPGDLGTRAPCSTLYDIYLDLGGVLCEPEFWRKMDKINYCRKILCESSPKEYVRNLSGPELWISIFVEIDLTENFPEVHKEVCSSIPAETPIKAEVFLQLVSLVRDLFYATINGSRASEARLSDRKLRQLHALAACNDNS